MRILMCSLESPGFLFPAIGLGKALAARGHEVAFVTDRSVESRLAQAGFARLPRGERDGRSFETGQWLRPLAVALQVQHVEHAMARFAPDLLVGQALTLGPLMVGERWGIPFASQGLATYLWQGAGQQLASSVAAAERRRRRQRDMLRLWKEARAQARLPALAARLDEGALLDDLFLLRSVAKLLEAMAGAPRAAGAGRGRGQHERRPRRGGRRRGTEGAGSHRGDRSAALRLSPERLIR